MRLLVSSRSKPLWLVLIVLVTVAPPALAQDDCSIFGQNQFVHDVLDEFYLWYRELPDLDPALFDSPQAYLEAVRYRPLDKSFSYITMRAASEAYYCSSEFIGIGFSYKQTRVDEIRISQVFPDSPASEVGLARGDYLLTVDGRPVPELLATGELSAAFGPSEIGVTIELAWRSRRGKEQSGVVTKRVVAIPTVSQTGIYDVDGLPVGYLHLRNFVEPSVDALNRAFQDFRARGVVDLILDLRYNGGGLVDVARHLAGLIGGMRTNGKVFVELIHNDKQTDRNRSYLFEDPPGALDVPRLVVITTRASASASELVINSLEPFIPVTIIGDRTFGKPVGQYGFDFCDKVIFPVAFKSVNALGEGDFFAGLAADCPAADLLDRPLGNPEEFSLAEALHFLGTGECSATASAVAPMLRQLRTTTGVVAPDGWRQLVNAW
jgi:carboxyl-terminal processing protease